MTQLTVAFSFSNIRNWLAMRLLEHHFDHAKMARAVYGRSGTELASLIMHHAGMDGTRPFDSNLVVRQRVEK